MVLPLLLVADRNVRPPVVILEDMGVSAVAVGGGRGRPPYGELAGDFYEDGFLGVEAVFGLLEDGVGVVF